MGITLTPDEWDVLQLSCKVAICCVAVSIVPAFLIAWLLARKNFFGKSLCETLVFLPMMLPPVVPGYLLLNAFGPHGFLGRYLHWLGWDVAFNWKGAVLASVVMGFPLLVQSIKLAIEMIDIRLEMAAKTLGASTASTLLNVTLPLAKTGILVGAMLCFCRSLGEFGATITFVGNIAKETRTLPLAIYSLLQQPNSDEAVFRLVMLSISISFCSLWLMQWLTRRHRERIGNV
jgi:molybdate transport system permease protein